MSIHLFHFAVLRVWLNRHPTVHFKILTRRTQKYKHLERWFIRFSWQLAPFLHRPCCPRSSRKESPLFLVCRPHERVVLCHLATINGEALQSLFASTLTIAWPQLVRLGDTFNNHRLLRQQSLFTQETGLPLAWPTICSVLLRYQALTEPPSCA